MVEKEQAPKNSLWECFVFCQGRKEGKPLQILQQQQQQKQ
jgi:hypothetical protein